MASVSVSHMILFIASMIVAASVAGVFTSTVDDLSNAIDEQGLHVSDDVRTDIEIISDNGTGACVYDCDGQDNLTLLVKNVGSNRLPDDPDGVDVLVNGNYQPPDDVTMTMLDGADTWDTSDVARLNVTESGLISGDHRAKVIVNGDEEVFEFRIP
jgi:flagellar protein FlaG